MDIIEAAGASPAGVVIALDRQEKGKGDKSAIQEVEADYGIPVPRGIPAETPDEAAAAAAELGGELWVVKAQVHAGGRGKAGGVKLARSADEVREHAAAMLGTRLVTHQSGPEGLPVNVVYVEAGSDIEREL